MKIIHVVDENILTWSRPWIQLLSFLQTYGLKNYVICKPGGSLGRDIEEQDIPVYHYRPPISNFSGLSSGLGKLFRYLEPDIIHTRLSSAALHGGYWGSKYGFPVVSTVDKYAKIKYYKRADMVAPVSYHLASWLEKKGFPSDKINVIPNSLCVSEYSRDIGIRKAIRKKFDIADNEKVILGAGRFVGWKGFDLLLEAFASVCEKGTKLWIAGSGPEEKKLQEKAEVLHLQDKVKFWGFVKDIRPLLWGGDLFVLPSREPEPFGLILLEAMASGLPVIATAAGGPLDMVTEKNGWLVKLGDVLSLSSALQDAVSCPSLGDKGLSAGSDAMKFDVSVVGKRVIMLYEDIVSRKAK